jgi:hypothetical protein
MKTYLTLDELKKICEHYDECMGAWPESKFEGKAIYEWVIRKLEENK